MLKVSSGGWLVSRGEEHLLGSSVKLGGEAGSRCARTQPLEVKRTTAVG